MEKRRAIGIGLISLVLLSLAFSFSPLVQAAQSPTISVSPASMQKSQGDTFTIEIVVDPKGDEIYAVQYDLYFNNILLSAASQTKGTFLSQDGVETIEVINEINNSIGKIEYGETRTGESGITNSGVVASISFDVIGTSGISNLKLGDVMLSNPNIEEIETEINDGTCKVGEVTGEPAVTATVTDVTAEEAHQMLAEESARIIFLDVRTEKEYKEGHIADVIHIPKTELESRIGELDSTKKTIVYCLSGDISRTASETLAQQGFEHVYNMLGGLNEWNMYFTVIKDEPTNVVIPSSTSPSLSPSPTKSPRFSPTPTSTASSTTTPPPKTTPTPTTGGFEAIIAITGVLVISYLFIRKRKER